MHTEMHTSLIFILNQDVCVQYKTNMYVCMYICMHVMGV